MRDVLLDTNVLKDLLGARPESLELFGVARRLYINTVVLGEFLGGITLGSRRETNMRYLSQFLAAPRVSVLESGRATAEHYADIWVSQRRKGRPIPTNDMWIAASAREHGLLLFTHDAHFREVDGLLTASSVDQLLP
jgi:tRNA(fMet)-specific endonuclease VapC